MRPLGHTLTQVRDALADAYLHLNATDEANAAANCAEVRNRPLTTKVSDALSLVDDLLQSIQ